jgi:hypothetical protein
MVEILLDDLEIPALDVHCGVPPFVIGALEVGVDIYAVKPSSVTCEQH